MKTLMSLNYHQSRTRFGPFVPYAPTALTVSRGEFAGKYPSQLRIEAQLRVMGTVTAIRVGRSRPLDKDRLEGLKKL